MLGEGPKVFGFDALTCEVLENFGLSVACADYLQPFPTATIERPQDHTRKPVVPFGAGTDAADWASRRFSRALWTDPPG
jgi:hypothetical protein